MLPTLNLQWNNFKKQSTKFLLGFTAKTTMLRPQTKMETMSLLKVKS